MITIVQRGGATREKPPEVVRGYASRLPWAWDGLCFGVPFNDATQDAARDLVWGAAPSVVSGLTWTKDDRGNPAALLDTTSYVDFPDNPAHNKPSTQITAYVRLRRAGTPDAPGGGAFGKKTSTGTFLSWAFYDSDVNPTAMQAHLSVGSTAYSIRYDSYIVPTTEWSSFFLRWSSGSPAKFDILGGRGNVLGSAASATLTGTIPYSVGEPIRINAADSTTLNYYGAYSQMMLWSRVLTDTEIQALVADPYGWYSPRRSTVVTSSPYPPIFGAGEMKSGTTIGGLR